MRSGPRTSRTWLRWLGAATLAVAVSAGAAACDDANGVDDQILTVGGADYPENSILAELYGQALAAADIDTTIVLNYGERDVLLDGLESGTIDLVAEYSGFLLDDLEGEGSASTDPEETYQALEQALAEIGLVAFEPSAAVAGNELAVTEETAAQFDLETYSDLAPVADQLVFGGPPECAERADCIPGLREVYGMQFADFVPLSAGPRVFEALEEGRINVARVFTTDPVDFVILTDDQGLNPSENVVPVAREEFADEDVEETCNAVSAALTTEELQRMVRQVIRGRQSPSVVATEFLEDHGLL